MDDLSWVSRLSSLQHMDLSGADLSQSPNNLIEVLNKLPSLLQISLSNCRLENARLSTPASLTRAAVVLPTVQYLNLSSNSFQGRFPSFLRNMTSLRALDLSHNYLNSSVPQYLGTSSYNNLFHLNLAGNRFDRIEGGLSTILWNQCHLKYLDLSSNLFHGGIVDLDAGKSSAGCVAYDLEILNLGFNDFTGHLPHNFLGRLKSLKYLGIEENSFSGPIPASLGGLSALRELSLSENQLTGAIPASLGNLSALVTLYLDSNNLTGYIPSSIGGLSGLIELDLSFNQLNGAIPSSIGALTSLRKLNLGFNRLNGTIPVSLGFLSKLESLEIGFNSLEGVVSEAHFANSSMLNYIDARSNPMLMFKMRSEWIPPFQLNTLLAGSCKVGPQFPPWLQTQKELVNLNLSDAGISGALPSWLHGMPTEALLVSNNQITGPLSNLPSGLQYLDLSHNKITGHLISTFPSGLSTLRLSHNRITGSLGSTNSSTIYDLDLSDNLLSGPLPLNINDLMPSLSSLHLRGNLLNGSIPNALCKLESLSSLDLSRNKLSGSFPRCLADIRVEDISLSSNMLTGLLPSSLGQHSSLKWLQLNNNGFHGELPLSLRNSTLLSFLDVSENRFSGNIPEWINGMNLPNLRVLQLHKNSFRGSIPLQLCELLQLQILDVAGNNLTGTIPRCFGNLTGMVLETRSEEAINEYSATAGLVLNIGLPFSMDLSSNELTGEIPQELTRLTGLLGLNLSRNLLTGGIPQKIGDMKSITLLDFSHNHLSGMIPRSITALSSLSRLNLSYNNFSGKIPTGNHLQILADPSVYAGNPKLCGAPLPNKCPR